MVSDDDNPSSGLSERLQKLLSEVPNMSELARISGLNRRMLDRYRAGTEPSLSAAVRLAKGLNVPLDALVYDVDVIKQDVDDDMILLPLLSIHGGAGPGLMADQLEVIQNIPFSRQLLRRSGVRPEDVHAIRTRGDSMTPTIQDGQILLIDRSVRRVRQDAVYALSIDDDIRIKRVQRSFDGSLTLKSDNPAYEPELLSPADAETLRIEGRVFWTEQLL
jgi:SOS-response transcriptional repressor LexA